MLNLSPDLVTSGNSSNFSHSSISQLLVSFGTTFSFCIYYLKKEFLNAVRYQEHVSRLAQTFSVQNQAQK